LFDDLKQEFIYTKEQTLQLEHSLVSLSKWESKWCKPFLTNQDKTQEEALDYIRCMTITQNVKPETYNYIGKKNIELINEYIKAPMTATTFSSDPSSKGGNGEQVTAELIYYWMIALNIPMDCQKWHLNRLLTLIKVCNIKNAPPKKMSRKATINKYAALNEARRKNLNSRG
jgi:hypothetical protein